MLYHYVSGSFWLFEIPIKHSYGYWHAYQKICLMIR